MKRSCFASACLATAATLALLPASTLATTTVYTRSDLLGPGSSSLLVSHVHQELHRPPRLMAMGNIGAGEQFGQWEVDIADPIESYSVLGIDSAGGVFVSLLDPALGNGLTFEAAFPGFSEEQVVDALQAGGGPVIDALAARLGEMAGGSAPMGLQCATTHFSVGAPYGSFYASLTPIPEPTGLVAAVVAMGLTLRRRR